MPYKNQKQRKAWYESHKAELKTYKRLYYRANRDIYHARQMVWQHSAKGRTTRKAYNKRYKMILLQTPVGKICQATTNLLRRFPGTSVATRKKYVICKQLIKTLRGDK